ncbi:DEAD/DEAH box helicase [Thiolapillus sp.]|uniref:DEAD/DEAH box helicase n=1 Tax=Thiolapillus sp. TaxID=2017437 RepID=UPI003AF4FDE0
MAFKIPQKSSVSIKDPESLFRDLRDRTVEGLLAQQADMLRNYMDHVDNRDIALELPTGSGKTLVGLLIAEWRRRTKRERCVLLCPTKQLVHQVVEQAKGNGSSPNGVGRLS